MKKANNIRTRITAGLLSTVTAFSVGVMAICSASAAETNSSEYIFRQNDADNPVSFATVTAEDYGKQAGVNAANAAFDSLGQVFPGASILVSPFKSLFNMNVKGDDPMTAVNNKLDKMDQKLDDISNTLEALNNNIDRNVAWLGNKTELSELKTNYRNLSAALEDFAKDIYSIETDDDLNAQQKMMKLATLKKGANFRDVKRYCTTIRDYMDGSNKYVSDCMFDLLYNDKAPSCMIEREAYNKAFGAAEDLTKQYMYAVSLLAECQKAADAVYFFKEADVRALGNGSFKSDYDNFDKAREILDAGDASKMLTAAAAGAENFQKHNIGKIIFKGTKSLKYSFCKEETANLFNNMQSSTENYIKISTLSTDEIKELAAYIRENYPGTSFYSFLKKWGAVTAEINIAGEGTAYLLTDTNLETKEVYTGYDFAGKLDGSLNYDCTVYAKGINIYDPDCREQSFKVYSYTRQDLYGWGIKLQTDYYNMTNTGNRIFTMSDNLSESEIKQIVGSNCSSSDYKKYLDWKADNPKCANFTYGSYIKYLNWQKAYPCHTTDEFKEWVRWWPDADIKDFSIYLNAITPEAKKALRYLPKNEFAYYLKWQKQYPKYTASDYAGYYRYIQIYRNYYGKGTPAFEAYLKYTQWKKNNPHKTEYEYFKSL